MTKEIMNREPWKRYDPQRSAFRKGLMNDLNHSNHTIVYERVAEYEKDFPECKEWLLIKNDEGQALAMIDEEHGRAVFPQRKENCFFSRYYNDKPILFRVEKILPWGVVVTLRTRNMKQLNMGFHV